MSLRIAAAAFALALAPLAGATAAPQILALVQTEGAKPLSCDGAECYAEFSSFCMEPRRASPSHASLYLPAEGALITLVATAPDGTMRRLPSPPEARYVSQRGYAAVRVSVPESLRRALGAERLAIEIGRRVALIPKPLPSHHRPHEAEQIATALGPNRLLGEEIVEHAGERTQGVRLLSYLINALPEGRKAGARARETLWTRALAEAPSGIAETGREIAADGLEGCRDKLDDGDVFSLRECLQYRHDHLMWLLNHKYWKSVRPHG